MTIDDQVLSAPTVSGPSGLSDLAVSPYGMSATLQLSEVRVAQLGRTSTEDQQDPRQSLVRQLTTCKTALPDMWLITCHFYDVESGRKALAERGRGTGYEERFAIPIPRDGGITDLLAEARRADRRFDVVICESVSRVARRTFEGLSIERELEDAGVPLLAANEPIVLTGGRAQRILQRRINQSVAEYEVLNTLEQSWGGMCAHTRDGYNIGKPLYGYKAKIIQHPNPTKAAKGSTKTRLEPDGARARTVTQIASWRYFGRLSLNAIVNRLNADTNTYPVPQPADPARARNAWCKSSVHEILTNPKYTGYQVFNRRASRSRHGQVNDPTKWVWSPEPAHEPLIPRWMYDNLAKRRATRQGPVKNVHPATRNVYLLRGRVLCACGRRMNGIRRKNFTYYKCYPRDNNLGRPDRYSDHPKSVYLREDVLLDAITTFYADRVFGPHRVDLILADLAALNDSAADRRTTERDRLTRALAAIDRKQDNLVRQAQDAGPDDPFAKGLRGAYNDLETQKGHIQAELASLEEAAGSSEPDRTERGDLALLDALPYVNLDLADAPHQLLRNLFDATHLTARMDHPPASGLDHITLAITLPATDLSQATQAAEELTMTTGKQTQQQATGSVDFVRAPGRVRTDTTALLRGWPLPIGLRGRLEG